MKIVFPNLPIETVNDISECLESIKEQCNLNIFLWNSNLKSVIDLFDEIQPDIAFVHQSQLDIGWKFICNEFNFKYILLIDNDIPYELLNSLSQKPLAIIAPPTLKDSKEYKIINIQTVARVAQLDGGKYNKHLESDILVDTTDVQIDHNVNNILLYLINGYRTKIIGENKVDFLHYLGKVTKFERANFIKSAKVVIDLKSNPSHCLDAAYLKIPSISFHSNLTEGNILQFNNMKELESNLNTMLNKDAIRKKYIDQCYKTICKNKTSYHFTSNVFKQIDENNISENLLTYLEGLKR